MDYIKEAKDLVKGLNQRISPSPYDTAWLARLRNSTNGGTRWPALIEWLVESQHPDGSWGGKIVYYHDRVVCTLAAAIALHENGHDHRTQSAVKRAEHYLWHHLHLLPRDPFELVGFELIVPELLVEAQMLGLDVPTHTCGYGEIQAAKLRMIPPEMLYSPHITTVHSLEFLGRSGDPARMRQALACNGSLGNSPATTAYYLLLSKHKDSSALQYLESVQDHMGYVIVVYPFRTFELIWVLNNLTYSKVPITEFAERGTWDRLWSEMGTTGVGADPEFGIPDGDTTSTCCRLLRSAGYDVDPHILTQFEDSETRTFRTYHYERNASTSTNVHALEALYLMPDYPDHRYVQEQIIVTLLDNRTLKMYWTDKWHASPYYATSHALIALLKEGSYLAHACHHTIDWLLHTQRDDGSWGFFEDGTAEETAYVLTALLHYHSYTPIEIDTLHRGAAYLAHAVQENPIEYPPLWIEKCLYAPYDIVRSAILVALILYDQTFGHSP